MTAPWIEAWKAWLARGAELFTPKTGPSPGGPRRSARPAEPAKRGAAVPGKTPLHRSGQRHG